MEVDMCIVNGSSDSSGFDSVVTAAQEVRKTWTFAPASQSTSQPPDARIGTLTNHNMQMDQTTLFSFRRPSRDAIAQSSGNDGLLRSRRRDAHKSARLLDPGHENGGGASRIVSDTPQAAHIPVRSSLIGGQDGYSSTARVQPSESHSCRLQNHKLVSSCPEDRIASPRYPPLAKPRKSLSERLHAAQRMPSPLYKTSGDLSETLVHAHTPLAKRGLTPSLPGSTKEPDSGMILGLDASESHVSVLNSKLNPRSRSASVSSTAPDSRGMQSVVMEAMNTIQRYESETEMQKREIERLTARIELLEKEKEKLNNRVQLVKNASLQKLATSSQNLEVLRMDLASLRSDLHTSASVSLADVQALKETISHALNASAKYLEGQGGESASCNAQGTREIINELKLDCMNKQQVLDMLRDRLTDALSELAASKNRIFELEDAYAVDKLALNHATKQLTATGSRISDLASVLKEQQKESVDALTLAGELELRLQASQSEVLRLDHLVSEFKVNSIDAASREHHISKLESLVDFQKDKIKLLDSICEENVQMKSMVKERDERIRALEEGTSQLIALKERQGARLETLLEEHEFKQKSYDSDLSKLVVANDSADSRNMQLKAQLHEMDLKSKALESELLAKSQLLGDLQALMGKLQTNFDAGCQSIKTLEAELSSSWAREAASRVAEASEKAQRLEETRVKTANAQQLMAAEKKIESLLADAAAFRKGFEEVDTRCKSVQDRFEEQSITLRLVRDTSAELQDRLIAAESGYAKDLEANCGRLRTQIAVLQEQNATIQAQLDDSKTDAEEQRKEYNAKEATLIQRIEDAGRNNEVKCGDLRTEIAVLRVQISACQAQLTETTLNLEANRTEYAKKEENLLQRIEDGRKEFDCEIRRARDMQTQVERELADTTRRNGDLESSLAGVREQLQSIPNPCVVHEQEIKRLTAQVSQITLECEAMKGRASTLNCRYDKGDLDPEERILIKTILNATQSMHVHELAEAQNELNRCKKTVSNLQDAKIMLENSLTKHLAAEAKLKNAAAKTSHPAIEYVNWPSSQPDVSMEVCVPPAQDKDEPSTAPDDPPAGEDIDTTLLPAFDPIRVTDSSPGRPLDSAVRFLTPASAGLNQNFAPSSHGTGRACFSTLAQDQSDEIREFEETPGTKRKKVQSTSGKADVSKQAKRTNTTRLPERSSIEPGTARTTYKTKRKRR